MASRHLAKGDQLPPVPDDAILFLSMGYCPYAQRVSLVLAAKGIKFVRVNCNLDSKPDFLLARNPQGKIPTIDRNGQVLRESEVICNLLEEWYPEVPLFPKDPYKKAKDRVLVAEFSKCFPSFKKILLLKGNEDPKDVQKLVDDVRANLTVLAKELTKRGTKYLGGDSAPGMVDYLCWPWIERSLYLTPTKSLAEDIHGLKSYTENMLQVNVISDITATFKDNYAAFIKAMAHGKRQFDW